MAAPVANVVLHKVKTFGAGNEEGGFPLIIMGNVCNILLM